MVKRKILIALFCLINVICSVAQEQSFDLSPLELSIDLCNYLQKRKIINTNFCIDEDNIGFNLELKSNSNNQKSYDIYFSEFIKSNLSKKQYESILKKYNDKNYGNYKPKYSNKKLWIVYKPIIIEQEYFVLILKQEKGTGDMFIIHLRMNHSNKFYIVNQSGIWQ